MQRALAALLLLALSLGAGTAAAQPVYERGNTADPLVLDPQRATTAAEANILRDLYEGLVVLDAAGALVPGIAQSWEISEDGLVYVFHLRSAVWSDGSPVTAQDFVAALRRLVDPATAAPDAHLFRSLARADAILSGTAPAKAVGVNAVDGRTLEITLAEPTPQLLQLLARPSALPVHRSLAAVPPMPSVTSPFNGAYRFDGFEPGEGLWLIRNQSFHDAANVAIETVTYRPYDAQRALQAFRDGALLSNNAVPVLTLADRREELGEDLRNSRYLGSYFYAANLDGPLADASLRRAVALAIDRNAINDDVWSGAMFPTRAIVPVGIAAYGAPAEIDLGPNERDARLAEARSLLAAAGYGADNPLALTIAIAATDLNRRTAAAIVEDLAEAGIVATLIERPAEEHYVALAADGARDFDLASFAWIGDASHVVEFLGLFSGVDQNAIGFANAEYDALIAEAAVTRDRTVQAALYAAADRLLMRELPAIPILQYGALNLVSARLAGWEDNVMDVHLTRWMSIREE